LSGQTSPFAIPRTLHASGESLAVSAIGAYVPGSLFRAYRVEPRVKGSLSDITIFGTRCGETALSTCGKGAIAAHLSNGAAEETALNLFLACRLLHESGAFDK
jgi:hypothetical protein